MALNNFSKVTSKGQITIPHSIREQLHLSTGSKLEFVIKDNAVIMMPINNKLSNLHGSKRHKKVFFVFMQLVYINPFLLYSYHFPKFC